MWRGELGAGLLGIWLDTINPQWSGDTHGETNTEIPGQDLLSRGSPRRAVSRGLLKKHIRMPSHSQRALLSVPQKLSQLAAAQTSSPFLHTVLEAPLACGCLVIVFSLLVNGPTEAALPGERKISFVWG